MDKQYLVLAYYESVGYPIAICNNRKTADEIGQNTIDNKSILDYKYYKVMTFHNIGDGIYVF